MPELAAASSRPSTRMRERSPGPRAGAWRWLVVFVCILFVYLAGPARQESDSYYAYATANSIVHRRTLDLSHFDIGPDYRVSVRNGERLNYFTWTTAIFAIPVVLALDMTHIVGLGPGGEDLPQQGVLVVEEIIGSTLAAGAAVLIGLAAGLLVRTSRDRFKVGVVVSLLFAFGTSAWSTASRDLNEHGPSLMLLAGALYCAMQIERGGRRLVALAMGALLAAAYTVRPSDAIVIIALGIWLIWRHRDHVLAYVVGGAALAVPWLLITKGAYGSWLQPYFSADRLELHASYGEALVGNLVSPARGLLVYTLAVVVLAVAGAAILAVDRSYAASTRTLGVILALSVVVMWAAISAFPHWWGGFSYGPRFFTDAGVVLALLLTPAVDRLIRLRWSTAGARARIGVVALGAAVLWSVFVHGQSAVFAEANCWNANPSVDEHPDRIWDWSDPQFLAGARSISSVGLEDFVKGRCPKRAS